MNRLIMAVLTAPVLGSIALTPVAFLREAATAVEEMSRDVGRTLAKATFEPARQSPKNSVL